MSNDTVSREEFEKFKAATADMLGFIHRQHVEVLEHVKSQHLEVIAIVKEHHDIGHARVLALKEMIDNFTATVQAILGERVIDEPTTPSVN